MSSYHYYPMGKQPCNDEMKILPYVQCSIFLPVIVVPVFNYAVSHILVSRGYVAQVTALTLHCIGHVTLWCNLM